MIEAKQAGEDQEYNVFDSEKLLCTVATISRVYGAAKHRHIGPDWAATKARAEHIAEALRHYQQSQEGERVP